jgi:septal ring factor EnvC (AmiA/AmiB activator)
MDVLHTDRTRALQPLNARLNDVNTQLTRAYTHQRELVEALNAVNTQIESLEAQKLVCVQTVAETDAQFKKQLAALEQANNVSLSSYELKDTVCYCCMCMCVLVGAFVYLHGCVC